MDQKLKDKNLWLWPSMLAITCISVFGINRYRYPGMAQSFSIPMLKRTQDPTLYPNDIYISHGDKLFSYYWHIVDFTLGVWPFSFESLLFCHYFFFTLATFTGIAFVVRALGGDRLSVLLASFFLLFNRSFLGNDFFLDQDLDTIGPARAMIVFAWWAFLSSKFKTASVLHGLAFLLHPLSGLYAIAFYACYLLTKGLRTMLLQGGLVLLVVTPLLLWKFSIDAGFGGGLDKDWLTLILFRSADHISPFSWSLTSYFYTGAMLLFLLVAGNFLREHRMFFVLSALAITLLCILGLIGTELLPDSFIIRLQLFRSTVFLGPLSAVAYGLLLERYLRNGSLWRTLLLMLPGLLFFTYSPYLSSWKFGLGAFTVFAFTSAVTLRVQPLTFISPVMILSCLLLVLGSGSFYKRGVFTIQNSSDADWIAVQRWAKSESAPDALFVVPPRSTGFRIESERSSFGSWFDGTILFFDKGTGKEWFRRMQVLGLQLDTHTAFFDSYLNSAEALQKISVDKSFEKVSEAYLIFDRTVETPLQLEASKGTYSIYRLK